MPSEVVSLGRRQATGTRLVLAWSATGSKTRTQRRTVRPQSAAAAHCFEGAVWFLYD